MNFEGCTTSTKDPLIVVKENRCSFEVRNADRSMVEKVKVDGCLIADNRERCDWIISIAEPLGKVMYVELKGHKLDKAISQLRTTILCTKLKYGDRPRECYAITTRVPKFGPKTQQLYLKFFKDTGVPLKIKNIRASVCL